MYYYDHYDQKSRSYTSFSSSIFCSCCMLELLFFFFLRLRFFFFCNSWGAYNRWRYICYEGRRMSSTGFLLGLLLFFLRTPFTSSYSESESEFSSYPSWYSVTSSSERSSMFLIPLFLFFPLARLT